MGYEFALDDKCFIRELDSLEDYAGLLRKEYPVSDERRQELYEEALEVHRERYTLINLRREEMGLKLIDEKELQDMEKDMNELWRM